MAQSREHFIATNAAVYDAFGERGSGIGLGDKVATLARAGYHDGLTLLDYGCGCGFILEGIKPKDYYGVDIVSFPVETARRKFPERRFDLFEIGELKTEPKDFVIAMSVFTHTRHEDAAHSLSDIYHNMAPGGTGLVDILEGDPKASDAYIKYWRKEDFVKLLNTMGFAVVDSFYNKDRRVYTHTYMVIKKMAWEHLNTDELDMRYKIAAAFMKGKTNGKVICDINCGRPGFYYHIDNDFHAYHANDLRPIEIDNSKFYFHNIPDDELNINCDILVLFGYGGGEFTGQELESKTAGLILIRLIQKYLPEFVIIEMAVKWQTDYQALTKLINQFPKNYQIAMQSIINKVPVKHYHDQRMLTIVQKGG